MRPGEENRGLSRHEIVWPGIDGTDPALPLHRDARVAHLHLHVPAIDPALDWFEGLGFARNLDLPELGMADMGAGAPYTHRLAVNIRAGRGVRPAPSRSARLLSYELSTPDAECFDMARSQATGNPGARVLTATDPAGVTVTLRHDPGLSGKEDHAA